MVGGCRVSTEVKFLVVKAKIIQICSFKKVLIVNSKHMHFIDFAIRFTLKYMCLFITTISVHFKVETNAFGYKRHTYV